MNSLPSQPELNARQRRFCELLVEGRTQTEAYRLAFGVNDRKLASRLATNGDVRRYLKDLQGRAQTKAEMTIDEIVAICSAIIRAKPSEAGPDNPLCELKMSKAGPYYAFPSKMAAIERLSKMLGWDRPTEVKGEIAVTIVKNW